MSISPGTKVENKAYDDSRQLTAYIETDLDCYQEHEITLIGAGAVNSVIVASQSRFIILVFG